MNRQKANGRMTAKEKVDQMIKGKPREKQIAVLNRCIAGNGTGLDVHIEAVNRKLSLECNGMSKDAKKHKPESEGIMKDTALLSAKIALGMVGC